MPESFPSEKLMRSVAKRLPFHGADNGVTSGVVIQSMPGWSPITVKRVLRHLVIKRRVTFTTGKDARGHHKVFFRRAPNSLSHGQPNQ